MLQLNTIVAGFAAAVIFVLYYYRQRRSCCRDPLFTEWPVLGMLPPLVCNMWRYHDYVNEALRRQAGTGNFIGPSFARMNSIITCDPMNAHHVLSKNFGNYCKGPVFRNIFKLFGDSIFTADSDAWKHQRAVYHSLFVKTKCLEKLLERIVQMKVETCLVPVLDHVERQAVDVDLQDVFDRLTFDLTCSILSGSDPKSLAIDFPEVECKRAFNRLEEFIFYRHVVPGRIWKLQRWLRIGVDKKMAEPFEAFDRFLGETIATKRAEMSQKNETKKQENDMLSLIMKGEEHVDDKFLRDAGFGIFLAGKGTITSALTWFFWLVAANPSVEAKIIQEIKQVKELKKQVYLHAALCEAVRLYPPVPYVRRQAVIRDMLPSGHDISPRTAIILSVYAMGRCEKIWGKDCLEFKPERWISERGGIVHMPSYKFISFNAGPRTCMGKDLAFIQMKMIATAILKNYHVRAVEGHPVSPMLSIVLLMKNGLKVRLTKRG
ncbi:alkane hydroxylase MAH1-like [Neltuma alba]|uniref:alkane hydroxylase MAH1-like n=1 Tax=Neltuma alba TaxID=207710 RepID=UPI0010A578CF|nr:alkane hydroxylase MAH1-like [Prosopis alba]